MKRYLIFSLLTFLFILFLVSPLSAKDRYRVKRVNDGDTIVLSDGTSVRYIGINTPEIDHERSGKKPQKAEPYGYKAKTFNKKLVNSKAVRIDLDRQKHDRFGRLLGYVYLKDGTFVNAKIVEHGYAYCLWRSPNTRYHTLLLKTQRRAMKEKRGIWSNWKEKAGGYVGNLKSKRFHRESCPFGQKTRKKNKLLFKKTWDAFYEGFAPCKKCF